MFLHSISSLTNFIQTYASLYPKQAGRRSWWRRGGLALLYIISYLMLSVEGSLGLRSGCHKIFFLLRARNWSQNLTSGICFPRWILPPSWNAFLPGKHPLFFENHTFSKKKLNKISKKFVILVKLTARFIFDLGLLRAALERSKVLWQPELKTKVVQHVPRIIFNVFKVFRFSSFQSSQVPSAWLSRHF